jgi:hypothetical protein
MSWEQLEYEHTGRQAYQDDSEHSEHFNGCWFPRVEERRSGKEKV